MEQDLEKIMHRKNFFLVRNGFIMVICILIITIIAMSLLKIDGQSILMMVIEYYLR
ncbi:MAG: hypothetical protein AAF611_21185 [Bacteroidota bacterium]